MNLIRHTGLDRDRSERQHSFDAAFLESQQSSSLKSVQITLGPAYDSLAWWGTDLYCTEHAVPSTHSQLPLQKGVACGPSHVFIIRDMRTHAYRICAGIMNSGLDAKPVTIIVIITTILVNSGIWLVRRLHSSDSSFGCNLIHRFLLMHLF